MNVLSSRDASVRTSDASFNMCTHHRINGLFLGVGVVTRVNSNLQHVSRRPSFVFSLF